MTRYKITRVNDELIAKQIRVKKIEKYNYDSAELTSSGKYKYFLIDASNKENAIAFAKNQIGVDSFVPSDI